MDNIKSADGIIYDREEALETFNKELELILNRLDEHAEIIKAVIDNNKRRAYFDHHYVEGLRSCIRIYYEECGNTNKAMEELKWAFAMPPEKMYD